MFLNLSLIADFTLGSILIFLWLVQRDDRHALYWGCGQILTGIAVYIWGLSLRASPFPLNFEVSLIVSNFGVLAYWFGTRYFCGLKLHGKLSFSAILVTTLVLIGLFHAFPGSGFPGGALLQIAMLLWCGSLIAIGQHPYRIVGLLLILRGLNGMFIGGLGFSGQNIDLAILVAFFLKGASVLGLIYAVLNETHQRFRAIISSLSNGYLVRDAGGLIRAANDKCAALLGYPSAADLVGGNISDVILNRTPELAAVWFNKVTAPDAPLPMVNEDSYLLRTGKILPVELVSVPFHERGQTLILVQIFDITERRQQEEALIHSANTDSLCGLCNRHALNFQLTQALTNSRQNGHECSLLFIDLDHFKRVNDALGHSVGDELLIMVAVRLESLTGPNDILARFGGDEFIIVQPDLPAGTGSAAACQLARKIIENFATSFDLTPNSTRPFSLFVTPSIGIALSPEHGLDPETLIKDADIAMYAAKAAGRNEMRLFDSSMDDASRSAMLIEEALHQALQNNEFKLVYQPIVSASNGKLNKVEALIRWQSPSLGFVPPDRFIPVAEETGMIVAIGLWVLQEACRQARIWADGPVGPICISLNVSAWQLVDSGFINDLREALSCNGIRPQQIEIELTERVLIEETDAVRQVLNTLHDMGVSISLDDFGTGYSSLSYLTRFQLNTLKIDRAFVTHITDRERDSALVRAIIAMGHSLGLQIVAEGVETQGQAEILSELGCQSLQGYLFSPPVPPEQILANVVS